MSFSFRQRNPEIWCVSFHKHKSFHCCNWGIIFVGGGQLLLTLLVTKNQQQRHVEPAPLTTWLQPLQLRTQSMKSVWKCQVLIQNFTNFQKPEFAFSRTNDRVAIWKMLSHKRIKYFCCRPCWNSLIGWRTHISWIMISLWQRFCAGDW